VLSLARLPPLGPLTPMLTVQRPHREQRGLLRHSRTVVSAPWLHASLAWRHRSGRARTAENSRIPSLRFRAASDARLSNLVRWSPLEIVGLDAPLGGRPLSKQALQGMQQTERLGVARDRRYLRAMCGCARLSSDVSEIKLVFTIRPHRRQRLDAVLAALPVLISCYRTVSKPHA
jgi:hypothetical protein